MRKNRIRQSRSSIAMDIVIYTVMIVVLLVCVIPFVYMIALSFSSSKAIVNNKVILWPVEFNVESYKTVL